MLKKIGLLVACALAFWSLATVAFAVTTRVSFDDPSQVLKNKAFDGYVDWIRGGTETADTTVAVRFYAASKGKWYCKKSVVVTVTFTPGYDSTDDDGNDVWVDPE